MKNITMILTRGSYEIIKNFFELCKLQGMNMSQTYESSKDRYNINLDFSNDDGFLLCSFYDELNIIYEKNMDAQDMIMIGKKSYKIMDRELHKIIEHSMRECSFNNRDILSRMIKNNNIQSLDEVEKLCRTPFSGIMPFDSMDMFTLFHDFEYIGKGVEPIKELPKEFESYNVEVSICNRYIDEGISFKFKNNKEVIFENCVINGDISLLSVEKVKFWNCIILKNINCFECSKIEVSECNIHSLEIYNSNVEKLNISYNNLYYFTLCNSCIKNLRFYNNRIINPLLYDVHLPNKIIDMRQFNMSSFYEKCIGEKFRDKFYLKFRLYEQEKKTSHKREKVLKTIDTLLEYGELNNDLHTLQKLKYKKMLYSNTGLSRIFVIITGGFYKPWIWLMYLLFSILLFSIMYSLPICDFVVTLQDASEVVINLNFKEAFQYSILQIWETNIFTYKPIGISQLLTVIQLAINTMLIANYFATLIKNICNVKIGDNI